MAFKDGVLYLVAFDWTTSFSSTAIGGISAEGFDLTSSTAELVALDGATGESLWIFEIPIGVTGSGPTNSSGLLSLGSLDGGIRVFSLVEASQVLSLHASAGINAPFAVVNDTVLVPAGSFIVQSIDQPEPVPACDLDLLRCDSVQPAPSPMVSRWICLPRLRAPVLAAPPPKCTPVILATTRMPFQSRPKTT